MKPSKPFQYISEVIVVSSIFMLLLGVTIYLLYTKSMDALEEQIKIGLISTVSAAATTLDGSVHEQFSASTSRSDPVYQQMAQHMESIRKAAADVRYIYTCILQNNKVYFIVNPSPQNDNDGDGIADEPPALMELYRDAPDELYQALKNQQIGISKIPYHDQWGTFISAYAPFYDHQGRFVGVLAMDLELGNFYLRMAPIKQVFNKAKIIIVFLGIIVGLIVWWIRRSHFNRNRLFTVINQQSDLNLDKLQRQGYLLVALMKFFYQLKDPSYSGDTQKLESLEKYGEYSLLKSESSQRGNFPQWLNNFQERLIQHRLGTLTWRGNEVLQACWPEAMGEALFSLYDVFEQLIHHPVMAEIEMASELLDSWKLRSVFHSSHKQLFLLPAKIIRIINVPLYKIEYEQLIKLSAIEIKLLSALIRLENLGCHIQLKNSSTLWIEWTLYKVK
ncbi:histidine kinase [Celerinatantimonas sp. YJH-8]|uniref:histidine kinase n=1 Tax=Celerinatantimonas sp. YJH-8 TaxID=3228714 RepID=UPI0038C87C0D